MPGKIAIVGEAFGKEEAAQGTPFVGASGHMLNSLLRQAGIERDSCLITNVFNEHPPSNDVEYFYTRDPADALDGYPSVKRSPKMFISKRHELHIYSLWESLRAFRPDVIIALGNTALFALTLKASIEKNRGAPLLAFRDNYKVLPSYHPAAVLRRYKLRPILLFDLQKALRESAFPDIRRPARRIILQPTLRDIEAFYETHIVPAPFLTMDTETKLGQITEVGFATDPYNAIVIPFWSRSARDGNYWLTIEHEMKAWEIIRRICATKKIVNQNTQYDMQYLWRTLGIPTLHFAGDTMLLHHSLQPELDKGLGFLGSIYTDEPAWKFMRSQVQTLKQED